MMNLIGVAPRAAVKSNQAQRGSDIRGRVPIFEIKENQALANSELRVRLQLSSAVPPARHRIGLSSRARPIPTSLASLPSSGVLPKKIEK